MKYADPSKTAPPDYIFDWDNMLAFEGNTTALAVCLYACAAVFRKADIDEQRWRAPVIIRRRSCEAQLAARLLQFEKPLTVVARVKVRRTSCARISV